MYALGPALQLKRPNPHLHLSLACCILPLISAHLLTVKINFHRLTLSPLCGKITMPFARELHFKFPTRLEYCSHKSEGNEGTNYDHFLGKEIGDIAKDFLLHRPLHSKKCVIYLLVYIL